MSVTLRPEEMARLTELHHAAEKHPVSRAITTVLRENGFPFGLNDVLSAFGFAAQLEAKATPVRQSTRPTFPV